MNLTKLQDHVRSTVPRLGKADGVQEADLAVDAAACSVHCHTYVAKDTSKERLLPGLHRTVILPGMVAAGSEELLCDEDGFTTEDVVAIESPNIVTLADGQDIAAAADLLKAI
uniref:Sucrose-phosphate synthase n=1 Tax=Oryza sativa subsp. japonica TaxID=39947 RepID=Q9FWN1_ORYSJ|nr:putative sucrose-phosphate synthase [Oryza sativa Japonica Group]